MSQTRINLDDVRGTALRESSKKVLNEANVPRLVDCFVDILAILGCSVSHKEMMKRLYAISDTDAEILGRKIVVAYQELVEG